MGTGQIQSAKAKKGHPNLALPRRGRRYPLLLHQRLRAMVFWPALLIGLLTTGLVILSPPGIDAYQPYLSVAGAGGWSLAVLTFWFGLRSYACCRADGLELQLPFYQLTIPYNDIQSTRLAQFGRQFPVDGEPWTRRHFLEPLFFSTVVVIQLGALPAPRRQLRLWMSKYLLAPDAPGFMLPVRDWLGFRSELDEFRFRSHLS